MESKKFIHSADVVWQNVGNGMERQILAYCDELMVVKVKFETGVEAPSHSHPHTQSSYIVSGKYEFTVDGVMHVVTAGDGILIKSGQQHQCTCIEPGIIIDTFTPIREDFL